ncbi:MAG TPA: lytic murein transglycosylase [Vicinamibacterales bacterium]
MSISLSRVIVALAVACATAGVPAAMVAQDPVASPPAVPFSDWLAGLRKDALAKGISERTVEAALADIEPLPIVVERDRTQAERTLSIDAYLKRRLDRRTVKTAREMARSHAGVLKKVSAQYGVPPGIIVAVWGLESNFGRFSGVRPTIASLATLAYDNRRATMFREELLNALRILDRGDIDLSRMKGSWAGAMGQPQFMPSSYLKYAEDFDHDGKRDIWGSEEDVFASIANYLRQNGWTAGAGWGRAVTVPKSATKQIEAMAPLRAAGCEATRQMTEGLALSRWRSLGIRSTGRQPLPKSATAASLVRAGTRDFLVLDNYAVLLQYNCAHAYALAVGLLADQVPAHYSTP